MFDGFILLELFVPLADISIGIRLWADFSSILRVIEWLI